MSNIRPLTGYVEPEIVIAALERAGGTLLCLAGRGRRVVVALEGWEVEFSELEPLAVGGVKGERQPAAFATGYLGVLSYDGFCPVAQQRAPHRVFRVTKTLNWDRLEKTMGIGWDTTAQTPEVWIEEGWLRSLLADLSGRSSPFLSKAVLAPPLLGVDGLHDPFQVAAYEAKVRLILEDILDGAYYQINLLRFFSLGDATFQALVARALALGASHTSFFRCPGLELVSLSPEQFVTVRCSGETDGDGASEVVAMPIKGTCPRGRDGKEDAAFAAELQDSPKERAELAMIIDLLRNDLHRVCLPHSVKVRSPGHIETLPYVLHRVGVVAGQLDPQLTLGEFLRRLMPAGSITGAPKIAAMTAMRRYEERDRGYFMGAAFCFDPRGFFASSVLIRTAYRLDPANPFDLAAGSGIVLRSEPAKEAQEVAFKCRVLTDAATGP